MILSRRDCALFATAAMMLPRRGRAATAFPVPTTKPILTISGNIGVTNLDGKLVLDRSTLEALGHDGFDTHTPWSAGTVRFDGVPMAKLMEAVAARGTVVRATALNDYTTDIPMADFGKFGVLLATTRNGEPMPVRDKGPLFIVYPYDQSAELQTREYYSRSAWQVASLAVT